MNHKPGDIFHNRYELLRLAGEGGMSQVWEAMDSIADVKVAIKIFNYQGHLTNHARDSFKREFREMCQFNHPNLFKPWHFDIEPVSQSPYITSKFYELGSAERLINKTTTALDEGEIARFIFDASSALMVLHSQTSPIIHQDIKPDNFLIDEDGKIVLTDFGVSTRKRETRIMEQSNEQAMFAGDTPYVAPERFSGALPRPSQDIFSLGVTIYEILTGVLPFQHFGGNLLNMGYEVPSLDAAFGYSARLNTLCQLCMQPEPEARPEAKELKEWATFFLSHAYWPEIRQKDIRPIKAKRIYEEASLLFSRLQGYKIDQVDQQEVTICLAKFAEVENLSGDYPDIPAKQMKLHLLAEEVAAFGKLEREFERTIGDTNADKATLQQFKNEYKQLQGKITDAKLESRTARLEERLNKIVVAENDAARMDECIAKPIGELPIQEARELLQKWLSVGGNFANRCAALNDRIKQEENYRQGYEKAEEVLANSLENMNIAKAEATIQGLKKFGITTAITQLQERLQKRVQQAELYGALKKQPGVLKKKLEGLKTLEAIWKLKEETLDAKSKCKDLFKYHPGNSNLLEIENALNTLLVQIDKDAALLEKATQAQALKDAPAEVDHEPKPGGPEIVGAEVLPAPEEGKETPGTKPKAITTTENTAKAEKPMAAEPHIAPAKDEGEGRKRLRIAAIIIGVLLVGSVIAMLILNTSQNGQQPDNAKETSSIAMDTGGAKTAPGGIPASPTIIQTSPTSTEGDKQVAKEKTIPDNVNKPDAAPPSNVPATGIQVPPGSILAKEENKLVTPPNPPAQQTEQQKVAVDTREDPPQKPIAPPVVEKTEYKAPEKPASTPAPTQTAPPQISLSFTNKTVTTAGFPLNCTVNSQGGASLTYLWEQTQGNGAVMQGQTSKTLTITRAPKGKHKFKVTVSDANGKSVEYVTIEVNPK